ncbi:hypothetical protein CAAN1_18S01662 [[Candida] anglica]|uniref:RING-type domain-containing protein n=1 Tax=[Candida] anglica TaxID=148631 RepID=A0ABP0EN08_9ASCO
MLPVVLTTIWFVFTGFYGVHSIHIEDPQESTIKTNGVGGFDPEYPFNNVVNSFFPLDALVEYENEETNETTRVISRYASFSAAVDTSLISTYRIFPNNGCSKRLNESVIPSDYYHKIIVLKRGDCTFVEKVENILDSGLNPSAIIIGNNEPSTGLITMYSGTFNLDGGIRTPILFVTLEDFMVLSKLQYETGDFNDINLTITTASIGSWLNLVLSMALSPPLMILMFYMMIKCWQKLRKKQMSRSNLKLVNSLPVYIYNINHLIPTNRFKDYLKLTNQSEPKRVNSTDDLPSLDTTPLISKTNSSSSSIINYMINGVDIKELASSMKILLAPEDYFPAYKCSICLDGFKPLQSKVLVLDCKHFYHQKCLSNWLINFRRSCPLCNTLFRSRQDLNSPNFGTFEFESQTSGDILESENVSLLSNSSMNERFDPLSTSSPIEGQPEVTEETRDTVTDTITSTTQNSSVTSSFYSAVSNVIESNQEFTRPTSYQMYSRESPILLESTSYSTGGGGTSIDEDFQTPQYGSFISNNGSSHDVSLGDETDEEPTNTSEITIHGGRDVE